MIAQPLNFNKPYILVTRIGDNVTNDTYYNPHQRYYEFDTMRDLFKAASHFSRDETPVSALRIVDISYDMGEILSVAKGDYEHARPTRADYFHDFTTALDEFKRGIRVEM